MKKSVTKIWSLLLCVVMCVSVLSGCGKGNGAKDEATAPSTDKVEESNTPSSNTDKKEDPVELLWYIRFDDQQDTQKVNEELNKLLLEKINATVKIVNIPGATYNDKLQVILGGREECDIVFAGAGFADFWGNATRGAFVPLNDLMDKYAKDTYNAIPEALWDGVKLNGNIYGVINYQIEAKEAGFYAPTELLTKYNFDLSKVTKVEEIEPLLENIKKDDKDVIPFCFTYVDLLPLIGYDEIGSAGSPGAVVIGDDKLKVVNQYSLESFKQFVTLMRKWYQAGYIAKDAATITSYNDLIKAGKTAVFLNNIKPGGKQEMEVLWNKELTVQKIMEGRVLPSAVSATLQTISSTSKHPEKAMEFINLVNTDKEIYNLLCFGIEGVHYNKKGDNRIELVENSGYQPNKAWAMGNQFNAYVYGTQSDTVWDETIKLNEGASTSDLLGFVFDPTPVKSQIAQCQSVWDQYFNAIVTGSVDPESYLTEFNSKLEAAGSNEVIAEKQKQLDAWLATK